MNNAVYSFGVPHNEPALDYKPGSEERQLLTRELERQASQEIEIPLVIGGKEVFTGRTAPICMPHDHANTLGFYHKAGPEEVRLAIEATRTARRDWMELSWIDRASIMLRAAELISKKYRMLMNAATMLGQSKNVIQAELDSACEVADFLRFNVYYASRIYSGQPLPGFDSINRIEYRPLEGFVLAVSPFNFTAIPANLNTSAALMGNTTLWKPASTSILSNYYLMKIFQEAGLPDGVINFLPGSGSDVGGTAMTHPDFAGLHFTGSTGTFNHLWRTVGENLETYRSYPRLVGETGGKDFVFAHPSADGDAVASALVRGAYEYQGQKCSAASRAYIPRSLWPAIRDRVLEWLDEITVGDVRDFSHFVNAVIDERAFDSISEYIGRADSAPEATILAGGKSDKSKGYFIEPTLIETDDPNFVTMREEIFGPVLTVYVYEDKDYEDTLDLCDRTSPYALVGGVFASDRKALVQACKRLRYAAGNLYYNDKPTGAVVGQQPFGGGRASGTNDKAGSWLNLMRWVSPRTLKENLFPATSYRYPFME